MVTPKRFDIYLASLDPAIGSEIKKTRPVIIISPDEMNPFLNTVIVAPLTTTNKLYPTRIPITLQKKKGYIVLDQIRTIDKLRLTKKLGVATPITQTKILHNLLQLFSK